MKSESSKVAGSAILFWVGWIITAIPLLFMGGMGTFYQFFKADAAIQQMKELGYPVDVRMPIYYAMMGCLVIYAFPRTAILGAILLTGYLGGATATHVRAEQPFYFPVAVGVLVWLGLYLRDARLRKLVPLR